MPNSLTPEEIKRHEEEGKGMHDPAIVHRCGGIPAHRLNICGICGCYIVPNEETAAWLKISEAEADSLRAQWRTRAK